MKKVTIINSINGDTYVSEPYNSWKKDRTVRQGNYGYGTNCGFWFFGEQLNKLENQNIEQIIITIKRQDGGINDNVEHSLRLHNYCYRPFSKPTFLDIDFNKTININRREEGSLVLSSKEDIDKFIRCRGFGLSTNSNDLKDYSVCNYKVAVMVIFK